MGQEPGLDTTHPVGETQRNKPEIKALSRSIAMGIWLGVPAPPLCLPPRSSDCLRLKEHS